MSTSNLGRLERVDLREAWLSEPGDFTPWLAQEGNLQLLGAAVGLDLELEAQEKNVGPFRADLLCKDTANGSWVLIENQLEPTDHTHLGQLLTYAAGLQAVAIVWIARSFTEEHRAALDWLNEITDERFNFFGLEVELWRIGNSPFAPKFNVVCKPNDWSKSITKAAERIGTGDLSETRQLYLDFWAGFREVLERRAGPLRPRKACSDSWYSLSIGRSEFRLVATISRQNQTVGAMLACDPPNSKAHYHLLESQKGQIEQELGQPATWWELPEKKTSFIALELLDVAVDDRTQWQRHHAWLADRLEVLHRVFADRVRRLVVNETESEGPGTV